MAGKLGKFQTIGFSHWKGLTKDNHLGSIFQMAPQKATNLMVQLLAYYIAKLKDCDVDKPRNLAKSVTVE